MPANTPTPTTDDRARVKSMIAFEQLVDDYFRHRRRRGVSPATEKSYGFVYNDLRKSLERRGVSALSGIDRAAIEAWQTEQTARGLTPATRSLSATAVRKLLEWAELQERPLAPGISRAVEGVKVRRNLPRPLAPQELGRLLAYLAPVRPRDLIFMRDRALILFLVGTAGRISEALQVKRDSFEQAEVHRKGGYQGILMAPPVAVEAIVDFLQARDDDQPWLFVGYARGVAATRLSTEGARHICHRLAHKCGIRPFSPHQLRHTAATELLDAGIQESTIATHLGHHGLGSLPNYAEVRPGARAGALLALEAAMQRARQGSPPEESPAAPEPAPEPRKARTARDPYVPSNDHHRRPVARASALTLAEVRLQFGVSEQRILEWAVEGKLLPVELEGQTYYVEASQFQARVPVEAS